MNRQLFLTLTACLLALHVGFAAPPKAAFEFSERGLSSVRYGNTEFLKTGEVGLGSLVVRKPNGKAGEPANPANPVSKFDPEKRRLTQEYGWGKVEVQYEVLPNRLNLGITISNTSPEPIVEVAMGLMELRFAETPAGDAWAKGFEVGGDNDGDITAAVADFRRGFMVLCNDDVTNRILLNFAPFGKDVRLIRMSTAPWTDLNQPVIPPGGTQNYRFSLRFDKPGVPLTVICADLYKEFLRTHPFTVKWEDRRPIAMLMLASAFHSSPTNPRGWFNEPKLDVRGPRGQKRFRDEVMASADRSIRILRGMDAQGMIVWNMEGEQFGNINYVGDPRMTAKLAPEMEAVAEEYFARFREAGFRTGVCIRPSRIEPGWDGKMKWVHSHMGFDVVEEMSRKIAYAKKRFGCTLFYIDSNARYFHRADGSVDSRIMEGDAFRRLARTHPDVLLIPEHTRLDYWSTTAPYRELRPHSGGFASTPADVLRVYPRAFSIINPVDAPAKERRAELVASFRRGDILLFRGWMNDDQNALFKSILKEARAKQ